MESIIGELLKVFISIKYMSNRLNKGSYGSFVVEGMNNGVKRTIKEWASGFGVTYECMCNVFCQLRKKGYYYYPSQKPMLVGGRTRVGIIVDIMKNKETLRDGLKTYEHNNSRPTYLGSLSIMESGINNYPELVDEFQTSLDWLQMKVIESRKKNQLKLESNKK